MIGIGTIVNAATVVGGGALGLLFRKGITENMQDALSKALGTAIIFVGLGGALAGMLQLSENGLSVSGTLLMVISLVLGTIAGELMRIEDGLEKLGRTLQRLPGLRRSTQFLEGFVTNSLVICVGAMGVVGSLADGLAGDPSTLYVKAMLDGIISLIFASTLGVGVLFAALPLFVYQGAITLLARFIEPFLSAGVIHDLSYIGSILIFLVGVNLAFGKRFRVGNMLPALLVPIIYGLILHFF